MGVMMAMAAVSIFGLVMLVGGLLGLQSNSSDASFVLIFGGLLLSFFSGFLLFGDKVKIYFTLLKLRCSKCSSKPKFLRILELGLMASPIQIFYCPNCLVSFNENGSRTPEFDASIEENQIKYRAIYKN